MEPTAAPVLEIVKLDTRLLEKAISGLDREALLRRVAANANPMIWIAGHLAAARFTMAALLGEQRPSPLGPAFAKGAAVPEDAVLPQAEQVLAAWREISPVVIARFTDATDAQLAAPSPRRFPLGINSVLDAVTFLAYHEGYHIGQMALIRKSFGLPGLVDA